MVIRRANGHGRRKRREIHWEKYRETREIRERFTSGDHIVKAGDESIDEFKVENSVPLYASILEDIAETGDEIFLDSNILTGIPYKNFPATGRFSSFLGFYTHMVSFARRFHTIEPCQEVLEIMQDLTEFYKTFLRRPNVNITSGVAEEKLRYIQEIKRKITHYPTQHSFDSALKKPLKVLEVLINDNMQRTASLGYEECHQARWILDFFNKTEYPSELNPSYADKVLVAGAVGAYFANKRNEVLLSNDKDVSFLLSISRRALIDMRKVFMPGSRANIEAKGIVPCERGYDLVRWTGIYSP